MLNSLSLPFINRALSDDPWAMQRLSSFAGSTLLIALADKPIVRYKVEDNGLLAAYKAFGDDDPTLSIDLPPDTATRFVSHGRHGILKAAKIRGNIELANAVNDVMENIRLDPEAYLATKIGDIAAHRAAALIRELKVSAEQLLFRFKTQFTEHVAEGHSVIVPNTEISHFVNEVDTLRNDVARLQQRIDRLTH